MIDRIVFEFEHSAERSGQVSHSDVLLLARQLPPVAELRRARIPRALRKRLFGAVLRGAEVANAHQDPVLDERCLEVAAVCGCLPPDPLKRLAEHRRASGRRDFDSARIAILAYRDTLGEHVPYVSSLIEDLEAIDPVGAGRLRTLAAAIGADTLQASSGL